MEYTFHPHNSLAPLGIAQILRRNLQGRIPVIACVGSDLSIGDSLGPLVGSMIKQQCAALFVYGTLANPVTAKEVVYLREFIAETHPRGRPHPHRRARHPPRLGRAEKAGADRRRRHSRHRRRALAHAGGAAAPHAPGRHLPHGAADRGGHLRLCAGLRLFQRHRGGANKARLPHGKRTDVKCRIKSIDF